MRVLCRSAVLEAWRELPCTIPNKLHVLEPKAGLVNRGGTIAGLRLGSSGVCYNATSHARID